MTFNELRLEYALEGISNYITWKDHMDSVPDCNGFLEYVKIDIPKLGLANALNIAQWKKDVFKARRIILKGVGDHIV